MATGGEDLCYVNANCMCNTTFHMFSGMSKPFLMLFLQFKVIFKVKNPFQGQFIIKIEINKITARRNKKAYEKHQQQTAIRHQNRYALNPIWPPSARKGVLLSWGESVVIRRKAANHGKFLQLGTVIG